MFPLWTAASEETGEDLNKDDEADEEYDQDEADHVQQVVLRPGQVKGGRSGERYDDDDNNDDDDGVDDGELHYSEQGWQLHKSLCEIRHHEGL